jgi:hypothetical protein
VASLDPVARREFRAPAALEVIRAGSPALVVHGDLTAVDPQWIVKARQVRA